MPPAPRSPPCPLQWSPRPVHVPSKVTFMLSCAGHARPVLCYPGSPAQGGCLWGLDEASQGINSPLFPAVHVPRRPPGGSVLPAFGAAPLLSLPEPEPPDRGLCLVVGEQESGGLGLHGGFCGAARRSVIACSVPGCGGPCAAVAHSILRAGLAVGASPHLRDEFTEGRRGEESA